MCYPYTKKVVVSKVFTGRKVWLLFKRAELTSEGPKRPRAEMAKCWNVRRPKWHRAETSGNPSEYIPWYQEIDFLISRNDFLISRIWFFWYQEMCIISWYQVIEFLISRYAFFDIKKSISWYQEIFIISCYEEIEFFNDLISRNRILCIKKCWINSKTAPHTYWDRSKTDRRTN